MGNKRITDLTQLNTPTGLSRLPIVHQGAVRNINLDDLFTYVDKNYFQSGKNPNTIDNLGNSYNQFKALSGNFIIQSGQIARISNNILRVDNSGFFHNFLSGKNVHVDNLFVSGLNLSGGSVQGDLTILGDLRVSGNLTSLSTDFEIEDKNITFASIPTGSHLNNINLDGAGFTVKGSASDKKITWYNTEVNNTINPYHTGTWQVDQNFQIEKKLRTSGIATFDSGIYITNSNLNNPVRFGQNINLHASGSSLDFLATNENVFIGRDLVVNKNLVVREGLDVSGNSIRLLGDVTLGSSASNSITFLGGFVQDVKPVNDWVNSASTPYQGLGISNKRWKEVYAGIGIFHDSVNVNGTIRLTGNLITTGNSFIGGSEQDSIHIISTPTFKSTNSFFQNNVIVTGNVNVSGNTILGDTNTDSVTIVATPTFRSTDSYFQNNVVVTGNVNVSGNTILGDTNTDTLSLNASINTNIIPQTNDAKDLGALNLYWRQGYIKNLNTSGINLTGNLAVNQGDITINNSGVALNDNLISLNTSLNSTGSNLSNRINSLSGSSDIFLRLDNTNQNINGDKVFLGNVIITNLTVTGTQSVASTNDLSVSSNFININSGESGNAGISLSTAGIRIDRGTGANFPDALLIFNEINGRFEFGVTGNLSGIAPIETLNSTITNLGNTGSNLSNATGILNQKLNSLSGLLTNDYVTLNTTQTISAAKDFTTRPTFNSSNLLVVADIANQNSIVFTTGNQTLSGTKEFATRPTVNGTGILLQNEATRLDNVVFQTGNQIVSGLKDFQLAPTVNGVPVLISGLAGSLAIQSQNHVIPNGVNEKQINFISSYNVGTIPVVIGNLYSTGINDEVVPFQIQNINHTGFMLNIAHPVTGYNFSFISFQNTGLNFIAQGPVGNIFNQKIQLNTGVTSQVVNFNTTFASLPTVTLQLEDRNDPPGDSFFLYRITGLSTTNFTINLSNTIPAPLSGFYMHVMAAS